MSVSSPHLSSTLVKFSAEDRFLIDRIEESIRDGEQLLRWCRQKESERLFFPLLMRRRFRLSNQAQGFFGFAEINGNRESVMGARQDVDFGQVSFANAPELLREFVLGEFLKRAHWTNPDGSVGGFTIEQSLFKTMQGEYGKLRPEDRNGCIDWRDLGRRYAWALLTIHINDFVMQFGSIRKRLREALCAAPSAAFVQVIENPSDEYLAEISIGYPVIRFAPIPNFFGFGPGKFQVAINLFSFFLTRRNELRVHMEFAAAPRCEKVFDFGKSWPDPIYGSARLLHRLTLGRWNPQPFHDFLDGRMLAFHCAVHQTFMDGVEKIWSDWSRAALSAAGSLQE